MIFYFTGTGNSLYAAKHFDKELYSIPKEMKKESRKYTAGILCRENQQQDELMQHLYISICI